MVYVLTAIVPLVVLWPDTGFSSFDVPKWALLGLGFERAIVYATGMQNIRDVIPFPRTPKSAPF